MQLAEETGGYLREGGGSIGGKRTIPTQRVDQKAGRREQENSPFDQINILRGGDHRAEGTGGKKKGMENRRAMRGRPENLTEVSGSGRLTKEKRDRKPEGKETTTYESQGRLGKNRSGKNVAYMNFTPCSQKF